MLSSVLLMDSKKNAVTFLSFSHINNHATETTSVVSRLIHSKREHNWDVGLTVSDNLLNTCTEQPQSNSSNTLTLNVQGSV